MRPENEDPRPGTVVRMDGASGSSASSRGFGRDPEQGPADPQIGWRDALSRLRSGALEEGLEGLEEAFEADGLDPGCQSAYALGLALVRGRFPEAVVLAQQAVRTDHRNAELYLNLAQIHEISGSRADAVQVLTRGIGVVPGHAGLLEARAALGFRHRVWLRYLPRGHWLNRSVGALRARLRRLVSSDS